MTKPSLPEKTVCAVENARGSETPGSLASEIPPSETPASETPPPESMNALLEKIRACRLCVQAPHNSAKPLPHEPRPVVQASENARICIVGQAPGVRVHASGRPFTDPSGVRLRSWLGMDESVFYDPEKVALVPMGFCFPGYNASKSDLPPRRECAPAWRDRLFSHLPQVRLLVILGTYAQRWHLGPVVAREGVNAVVSRWHDFYEADGGTESGVKRFVLPHPSWRNNAWLKRNPWFETELLPVLKQDVREALGTLP